MVNLADPDPQLIVIDDIAHQLGRVCRYGGAVDTYYSVASHSVYVAQALDAEYHEPELTRAGLLHDAAEAYLGDQVSYFKRWLKEHCPEYGTLLRAWDLAIEETFGVSFEDPRIKEFDLRARLSEIRDVFLSYPRECLLGGEGDRRPLPAPCVVHTPDEGTWAFLAMAHRLGFKT